jgi:hypothetical protein
VITFAHVAGVPVEELLPLAPGAAVVLTALAARLRALRHRRPRSGPPAEPAGRDRLA